MMFICDVFGGGWRWRFPAGTVECNDPSWFFYVIGLVVAIGWILPALLGGGNSHEAKREESADIYAERQAINSKIEREWWKLKAGNGDRNEVSRLEAELRALEDGIEIAPGDGVYLRRKRK